MPPTGPVRRSPTPKKKRKTPTARGPQGLPTARGPVVKAPAHSLIGGVTQTATRQAPKIRRAVRHQERKQRQHLGLNPDRATGQRRGTPSVERLVREERLKYLRRTHQTGGQTIDLSKLANLVKPENVYTSGTGAGPTLLRIHGGKFATVRPPLARVQYAGGKVGGRLIADLLNFPASAVVSGVQLADAGVSAAKGHPAKLKAIGRGIDKTDPLYNLGAAGVEALTGGEPGKRLAQAGRAVNKHPGFALIEAVGAKGTLGRAAGRTARSGVLGAAARRAASTAREPSILEGTALAARRTYSKDVFSKTGQVARERAAIKRAGRLRAEAERVRNSDHPEAPERAAELERRARKVDPRVVKPSEIRKRIDERAQLNEDVRRENRSKAQQAVRKALKHVKAHERPIVSLVAQAIVKPTREDLAAYMAELEREYPKLDRAGKRANAEIRRRIKSALDHDVDLTRVARAAKLYKETLDPLQAELVKHGFLDAAQADKARLIPYAIRHMGAHHDGERLVVKNGRASSEHATAIANLKQFVRDARANAAEQRATGKYKFGQANEKHLEKLADEAEAQIEKMKDGATRPLDAAEIKAHMADNGVEEPTFLTQAPGMRGAKNFAIPSERGTPSMRRARRTGEATRKGTFDVHPDTLPEGAARAQGLIDAAEGFWGAIGETGLRGKSGKIQTFKTYKQVENHLRNRGLDGEQQWRPVRVLPFSARREQLADALEHMDSADLMHGSTESASPVVQSMMDALEGKGTGDWALIPEEAAQQMAAHLRSLGSSPMGKAGQAVGQAFRKTVLATSTTWATGNTVEAALRTLLDRAGPRSYLTYKRTARELERTAPRAAQDVRHRAVGGGHFGTVGRTEIHRSADQFIGSKLHPLARGLERFWKTPGPKQAAGVWHLYTDVVFGATRWVESQFQQAMAGKYIRETLLDDRLNKLSKAAMEQAARGLKNTDEQVAMGRAVDRAYGRYSKWSPEARLFMTAYTPFIAWTRAAGAFVIDVLPRDHPTTTAMIAMLENQNAEWRKLHGLDVVGKGRLPGFLQGSTPTKGGGHQRAPFRYTPFGAFGDPLETVGGGFLPQFSSVIKAFEGQDWKGAKLRSKDGGEATTIDKGKAAAQAFLEGTIPILAQAGRIKDKGIGALNPFAPIKPKQPGAKASGGGSKGGRGVDWHQARKSTSTGSGVDWGAAAKQTSTGSGVDWSKAGG